MDYIFEEGRLAAQGIAGALRHETGTPEQLDEVVPGDLACKPHQRFPVLPTMPGGR